MNFKYFISGFKEGQKSFFETISVIVNSFLLTLVYIFGVGLTYLFSKITKKSFLELHFDQNKKTYWEDLNLNKKDIKEYNKLF